MGNLPKSDLDRLNPDSASVGPRNEHPNSGTKHHVERNSRATPEVNNRNAQGSAGQGAKHVHFRQVTDPAHSLQKRSLSARESPEKQNDRKQSDIGGVIGVPKSQVADPFARQEERRGTEDPKHQANPSEREHGS